MDGPVKDRHGEIAVVSIVIGKEQLSKLHSIDDSRLVVATPKHTAAKDVSKGSASAMPDPSRLPLGKYPPRLH